MDRQTDRQMGWRTDGKMKDEQQIDRWRMDRYTDRHMDGLTDRREEEDERMD
jgi:hypothetical protein